MAIEALAALGFARACLGYRTIVPLSYTTACQTTAARPIAERLAKIHLPVPLGLNLVKTNRGPGASRESGDQIIKGDRVINEYVEAARVLSPVAE